MSANYDSPDDRAVRLYLAAELDRQRGEYLVLAPDQRLAYAKAHPSFALTAGGTPQLVLLQIQACVDAGEPDQAAALAVGHRAAALRSAAAQAIKAQAVTLPERVVLSGSYAVFTAPVAIICGLTGYLAAGPHAALVAACPAACFGILAIIRRLASPVR